MIAMANERTRTGPTGDWDETPWSLLVLVCGTCARRAGRKGLRSDLKSGLKTASDHRRVKVAETGCLGLCPKRAIVVATPADLARGAAFVLRDEAPVPMPSRPSSRDQNSAS